MDDDESTFQLAERLYYADVYANIVKTGASPSDSLDVADRESQRPETEVIKHQRYQWVINSETETLRFDGSDSTIVDADSNQITVPLHRLKTGFKVEYNSLKALPQFQATASKKIIIRIFKRATIRFSISIKAFLR